MARRAILRTRVVQVIAVGASRARETVILRLGASIRCIGAGWADGNGCSLGTFRTVTMLGANDNSRVA